MVYHDHNKSGTGYSNFFDGNSKTIGPFFTNAIIKYTSKLTENLLFLMVSTSIIRDYW